MAESSPKFSLVRCPKCDRLLPELPPHSVYRCGGCDAFLKAHKTSVLSGNLSSNYSEGRFSDASEWSTPTKVSNSPLKHKFGDTTRKAPVTETIWSDDEGDHGVERRNRHRSSNYRAELLREYNELHEKLIRVGDLISHSQSGQEDQSYASRTVRSAVMKRNSRMRPHYVSDKLFYNLQKFATQQPICDSTYDSRRKYVQQRSSTDSKSDEGFCHPIVGGAPFVICHKCFQLLRLTGKLLTTKKTQFRVQCGFCHTILSLDFNKRSDRVPSKPNSANVNDVPHELASDSAVKGLLPLCPPPCSPSQGHKDHVYATKTSDKKQSETLEQDKATAEPTELELKSTEIPKTDSSQGSEDANIRRDEGRCSEANLSSSFANAKVSVNGTIINPNSVIRAEKKAGPISPGEYWYDSRAGFWGAMGDHCLGIIPPFIEEFSSKMPENCSGGETCIYVNGRELHENDLDLLSTRGLPRTRFKYYVVDKSGKVHDEDTGGFVVNLGKLAPTVESTGCGFGMHFPKAQKC